MNSGVVSPVNSRDAVPSSYTAMQRKSNTQSKNNLLNSGQQQQLYSSKSRTKDQMRSQSRGQMKASSSSNPVLA